MSAHKPLAIYRQEELAQMQVDFYGSDPRYHEPRRRFVFEGPPPAVPQRAPGIVAQAHMKRMAVSTSR